MENLIVRIHNFFFAAVATLFFFQAITLFVRSKNNKARKTMAFIELLWGIEYLFALILMNTMNPPEGYSLFREKVLIVGNYYILFIVFFPMQVLIPGWLNWKKIALLVSPIVAMTVLYYGGMFLLNESPEDLYSYPQLWAALPHFNVWFRFVMLLSNLTYIIIILKWLNKYEQKYTQWKNDNFSDQEYVDASWMKNFYFIIIGIFTFYMGILVIGGRISVMCHCTFAIVCFSYLFYKSLFYESPYPMDFFATKKVISADNQQANPFITEADIENLNEEHFEKRLTSHMDILKKWMDTEKPYLHYDFKLTDVAHVIPLNRSHLSRLFNEGYGQCFSQVIRIYRINYSKQILKQYPEMPLHKVASSSGFHSDTIYIRAFKQVTGITPNQYKETQTTRSEKQ